MELNVVNVEKEIARRYPLLENSVIRRRQLFVMRIYVG